MSDQHADLEWRDGRVPISVQFDDPYFSLDNGLAETQHVFIDGNDLRNRLCDGFHIAELGFGTGLNLLTTLMTWQEIGATGKFRFTSFEAFPMSAKDLEAALNAFPTARALAEPLITAWAQGITQFETGDMIVDVIIEDARQALPHWGSQADAWFLDGFSPAKNPELWDDDLLQAVGNHTKQNGTCATYTAAGFVRRALNAAGFEITRTPGFGRKRHMTRGVKT